MKFAFFTLGCKVNLFETQALRQLAKARGHQIVTHDADAVIVNTCTVTSVSDHKNIRAFHRLRRDNPRAVIAACGCFAQAEPERIRRTGEVDLICGTSNRAQVIRLCEEAVGGQADVTLTPYIECTGPEPNPAWLPAGVPPGRTRALLKLEDGCDCYCSYCIIPYVRGHVHSLPPDQAMQEALRLEQEGAHEIVLTGIEMASYGRDLRPPVPLPALVRRLLAAIPAVRFRLGSLDPRIIDQTFCDSLQPYQNLARHFHLSLQSGCDSVLQRMGRRYTTEEYYQAVSLLRAAFPDCSITTDLIVGFPGETEEEFAQTLLFLERCAFASVHVFPYSARNGTRAASMDGQLSRKVKAARAEQARMTATALSMTYRWSFLCRTLDVLPEHLIDGYWAAHGLYGFPVYIADSPLMQKNHPVTVYVTGLYRDGVQAEISDGM